MQTCNYTSRPTNPYRNRFNSSTALTPECFILKYYIALPPHVVIHNYFQASPEGPKNVRRSRLGHQRPGGIHSQRTAEEVQRLRALDGTVHFFAGASAWHQLLDDGWCRWYRYGVHFDCVLPINTHIGRLQRDIRTGRSVRCPHRHHAELGRKEADDSARGGYSELIIQFSFHEI